MKRIVLGFVLAVVLAIAASVIWIPGCGYVDTWLFWTWSCDSAGGGGGGAS